MNLFFPKFEIALFLAGKRVQKELRLLFRKILSPPG